MFPNSTEAKSYSTEKFDISKDGIYRLRSRFSNEDGKQYDTWLEFEVESAGKDIVGVGGEDMISEGVQPTLEDVIALSAKAGELNWGDFEKFTYTNTGSGLYIRRYDIDEMFSVSIGGPSTDEYPTYIYLQASVASDAYINIRTDDVEAFINAHKDDPVVKNVGWSYHSCVVDHNGDNSQRIAEMGNYSFLIGDKSLSAEEITDAGDMLDFENIKFLPTVKITSTAELRDFKNKMDTWMFDSACGEITFNDASKNYADKFFLENTLFLFYVPRMNGGHTFSVEYITKTSGLLSIDVVDFLCIFTGKQLYRIR